MDPAKQWYNQKWSSVSVFHEGSYNGSCIYFASLFAKTNVNDVTRQQTTG